MAATASFRSAVSFHFAMLPSGRRTFFVVDQHKVRIDGIRVPLTSPLSSSELLVCNRRREKAAVNESSWTESH